jgi:hypothetical protein
MLVAFIIWLHNCPHAKFEKPYAYHKLMCSIEFANGVKNPVLQAATPVRVKVLLHPTGVLSLTRGQVYYLLI